MNKLYKLLQNLLRNAYEDYEKGKRVDLVELTRKAKICYKTFRNERKDHLVPNSPMTLLPRAVGYSNHTNSYSFKYKFPNDKTNEEFINPYEVSLISKGTKLDRLGSDMGRYLSPIKDDGKVYSVSDRALPYFFMEKSVTDEPAYHKYEVIKDISKSQLIDALTQADISLLENNEKVRQYLLHIVELGGIMYGQVAPVKAFGKQGDGMGMQYRFPIPISYLISLGFLEGC